MKSVRMCVLVVIVLASLATAGCSAGTPIAGSDSTSAPPAATETLTDGTITAAVEVKPVQVSDLAFLIDGRVQQIHVKEGEAVAAGDPLITLEAPDLEYALVSAQAEAESAELNQFLQRSSRQYKVWSGRRWIWTRGLQELRLKADARFEQAQGARDVAAAELAQATIVAPFDGTVIEIDAAPGEMIEAHTTAVVVADLRHLEVVTTDLSERDLGGIRIGQPASVQFKAFGDEFSGRVAKIGALAQESEDGDTVFEVTIALDGAPPGLRWGMTGDAFFTPDS